jgi:galactose mutarotase-like enzyme
MLYTLENKNLIITASTYGGELHSIREKIDNTEYLWNGDEKFWKYHAPVLFPIVGKVNDGKYKVEGKLFELPQHGLARTREFVLAEKTEDSITFQLDYSNETLEVYPYKFTLKIKYTLLEDRVITSYTVINKDNKEIFFSIGAHPAFMCPIKSGETIEDYYFEFNKVENSSKMLLNKDGYLLYERVECLEDSNIIPLSLDLFKNDALIFDDLKSNRISLKSKNHKKLLTMDFTGFPYMGLWTKDTGAPFVCIEPWCGHADYYDFQGEFKDKKGINKLEVGQVFNISYTVIIGNEK